MKAAQLAVCLTAALQLAPACAADRFDIAITVDDLPYHATLPDVMARLDAAGARYVTLAQAQSDPAYAEAGGGSLVTRAAKKKGIKLSTPPQEEEALDVKALCR